MFTHQHYKTWQVKLPNELMDFRTQQRPGPDHVQVGTLKGKQNKNKTLEYKKKLFFLFEDFSIKNIATTGFDPVTPGL